MKTAVGAVWLAIVPALCVLACTGSFAAQKRIAVNQPTHVLSLGFDKLAWEFSSRGKYLLVRDPRGFSQIFHPWDRSEDGDFGSISSRVSVPPQWHGPVFLSFYAADTYVAEGWEQARARWTHSYAAVHTLIGHRFKQVLIDGQLVWEQDVADDENAGYASVDISKHVEPGKAFDLVLRVIDKVNPATKLPGDDFRLGIWSWQAQSDKDADKRLYTRVFWGDIALSEGAPVAWDANPARSATPLRPVSVAPAKAVERGEGVLTLSAPDGLPEGGYPVTWGVPFAQGRLRSADQVSLTDPDGKPVPLQTQVLHKWPDGSIHWLLLDFQAGAAGANKDYTLSYGTTVQRQTPPDQLHVSDSPESCTVQTGALTFEVDKRGKSLLKSIQISGETEPIGKQLTGLLIARDGWVQNPYEPVNESVTVESRGPERAEILITGKLVSGDKSFGRFTCRIDAYRGKPYIRVFFRVFNDTDAPAQLVEEMLLRLQTSMRHSEAVLGDRELVTGPSENQRLLVRQDKCDAFRVFDGTDTQLETGKQWAGPISLQTPEHGVSGAVRHFAQLYPKRMWAGAGGVVEFNLFSRTVEYEQYVMTRGEAKRHEVLLYFHKGNADPDEASVFKAFETPPVLISAQWYADNQALGRAAPLTPQLFPELHKMITSYVPGLQCSQPQGIRNWPDSYSDSIYSAYRGTWSNMYQEMDYGSYAVGLLAGRREWIDYARAYQEHFMDIDICHHSTDPSYVGASYGISQYHTGHPPYALNAPLGGLFLLYYLTGDRDARDSAVGIADWLYRTNLGIGAGSGRAVGWPLRSSMIAYENTGDPKHLEAAKRLADFALAAADSRRGFFSEPPATWNYRGGVPGMNSILMAGLMHYWRVSRDERIGRLCSNISYNMAYSWMSPTEPGLILNGDPLQQVYLAGYAMQDVMPLFWGYELTGDANFLRKGMAVMQASILDEKQKGAALGLSRYWELQDLLYYYRLAMESEPAHAQSGGTFSPQSQ